MFWKDKKLYKRIREVQYQKNFDKLGWILAFLFAVGAVFLIISKSSDYRSLLLLFSTINISASLVGLFFWLIVKINRLPKKYERIFTEVYLIIPFLTLVVEDNYLLYKIDTTMAPFLCYTFIWLFLITVYDVPFVNVFLSLLATSAIFYGAWTKYLHGELYYISLLYLSMILVEGFVLDRISCKNYENKFELEEANNTMAAQVKEAVEKTEEKEKELKEIQAETIAGLANLIESRSGETGSHVKNTQNYMHILAKLALNQGLFPEILTEKYAQMCVDTAVLHDIGKITVPDYILNSPNKLSREEFEIMKKHTTEGEKMVESIIGKLENEEYIKIAKQIAVGHHERWDGKGYPYGLSGYSIPLCARMMAIVDVYDALISERCYKKPMSKEEALKIIIENAGSQFDPILTKIFVKEMKKNNK